MKLIPTRIPDVVIIEPAVFGGVPSAQGKLVRVVQGTAFVMAADICRGSSTFNLDIGIECLLG